MDIHGKVVVVTGAGRGLGLALALALEQKGATVVATDTSHDVFQENTWPETIHHEEMDVTNPAVVQQAIDRVAQKYGRIDIVVNNAGVWTPHRPFTEITIEDFHRIMNVNFWGTLNVCKATWPSFVQQRSGALVNILSIRVVENKPGTSAYASAKGAAWQLTNTLRLEGEPLGIQVLGVFPSRMKTKLFDQAPPADYDHYLEPSDVAARIIEAIEHNTPELHITS